MAEQHVLPAESASDADSAAGNASREQIASSATPTQATAEVPAVPAQAVQMSLTEARRLLDKDLYGLDKVCLLLSIFTSCIQCAGTACRPTVQVRLPVEPALSVKLTGPQAALYLPVLYLWYEMAQWDGNTCWVDIWLDSGHRQVQLPVEPSLHVELTRLAVCLLACTCSVHAPANYACNIV